MAFEERELEITAVERNGYLFNKAYRLGLRAGEHRRRRKGFKPGPEQDLAMAIEMDLMTAVGDLLHARGLGPTTALLVRLGYCTDHALLRRAVVLAATAESIAELAAALWPNTRAAHRFRASR